ncbi:MAG TPA: MBL fold metallo-hydrolase [Actinomycetales bacterium]|nr:MBL fold metallo-hydrolase [Actinomycetales bacterium]
MEQPIRIGPMTLRYSVVSEMENNVYLLTHTETGAQVLIDAADDAPAILQLLEEGSGDVQGDDGAKLVAIFTTHAHTDHTRALAAIKEATGAMAGAGDADAATVTEATGVPMDFTVAHGDVGNFDGFDLEAISLRGHTPGSTALALEVEGEPVHLFVGDSLFPGGVGKTDGEEDFTSLIEDVEQRLFERFGDDAVVWPGHGKHTTLGDERGSLEEWRQRGW